ncbi:hypothetical protein LP419_03990 [Massilia sp. H-1]|nr:hypothetical protein LP419_03990 [Massilia sp. H-1]
MLLDEFPTSATGATCNGRLGNPYIGHWHVRFGGLGFRTPQHGHRRHRLADDFAVRDVFLDFRFGDRGQFLITVRGGGGDPGLREHFGLKLPAGGKFPFVTLLLIQCGAELADRALGTQFNLGRPLFQLLVPGLLGIQAHRLGLVPAGL